MATDTSPVACMAAVDVSLALYTALFHIRLQQKLADHTSDDSSDVQQITTRSPWSGNSSISRHFSSGNLAIVSWYSNFLDVSWKRRVMWYTNLSGTFVIHYFFRYIVKNVSRYFSGNEFSTYFMAVHHTSVTRICSGTLDDQKSPCIWKRFQ